MLVYVAGALSNSDEDTNRTPSKVVVDYINNCRKMLIAAREVIRKGHAPFVPALDFLTGLVSGDMEEKDYRLCNLEFLSVCDVMLVLSRSSGVREEIEFAKKKGIPVCYKIEDLPSKAPGKAVGWKWGIR